MKARMLCRIVSLVRQQPEAVLRSLYPDHRVKGIDVQNKDQVYHVLLACLNLRCKGDLDLIVQRCYDESVVSDSSLERSQWNIFTLNDRGVGIECREVVGLPFSAAVIF